MNIFIAGSRAISKFDNHVIAKLSSIYEKNYTVLVGDANGVDKCVQQYFFKKEYANVIVYASNGAARNNIGNWNVKVVDVPENIKGFDFYAKKDEAMARNADFGFMIWDGEGKGTLNNMVNLIAENKNFWVYFTPKREYIFVKNRDNLACMISMCTNVTQELFSRLCKKNSPIAAPRSLFDFSNAPSET